MLGFPHVSMVSHALKQVTGKIKYYNKNLKDMKGKQLKV